jgi:hypothetical protein
MRNRSSAFLYLALVFASGILVGAVSHRLYMTNTVNAAMPRTMDEVRKNYLADMKAKVGVSDQQVTDVTRILDDTKRKFDELHAEEKPTRDRIQQEQIDSIHSVLSDDQKVKYDNWRAERARRHAQQVKQQQKPAVDATP